MVVVEVDLGYLLVNVGILEFDFNIVVIVLILEFVIFIF